MGSEPRKPFLCDQYVLGLARLLTLMLQLLLWLEFRPRQKKPSLEFPPQAELLPDSYLNLSCG